MASITSTQDSERDRNERIYRSLPKLGSDEYMLLLRQASAADLPAPVLVRAYQQLGQGAPAEATLGRLLTNDETYGYLRPLRSMARRKVSSRDWFSADDLVDEAIGEIALALPLPRGAGADLYWISFLKQRLEDAYRSLNGRRRERQDPPRAESWVEPESGQTLDPLELAEDGVAPWHGRVKESDLEWLEDFVTRTLGAIMDERIRAVAIDLFSADPSAISGTGPDGRLSLTEKFCVDRHQIYRWRHIARVKLFAALRDQNERDIDISWLEASLRDA